MTNLGLLSVEALYGEDFTFSFFPYRDGVEDSIPSQNIQAYVFETETRPTNTNALNGVGADQSPVIVHVTNDPLPDEIEVPVDAISDPEPENISQTREFWICILPELDAGGQKQLMIRSFKIGRIQHHSQEIGVEIDTLKNIFPKLNKWLSDAQIEAMMDLAEVDLREELRNEVIEWAKIHRLDRLYHAKLYQTQGYIYESQIQVAGDKWDLFAERSQTRFASTVGKVRLEYDADKDGLPESERRMGGRLIAVR